MKLTEKIKSLNLQERWHTPPKGRYLSIKEMGAYGVSGLGVAFIVNAVTAMITAQQIPYIYEIDIMHGTVIFLIVGILNLIIQPFYGQKLQNTKTKNGRYKPFIIGIAPIIAIFLVLSTWLPQVDSTTYRTVFAYATCIPVLVLWNIWNNTYYMVAGAMTPISQERTDMLAPLGLIAGFAPTVMNFVIGPIRSHFMEQGREYMAFRVMGIISAVIGVFLVFFILKTKERIYATPQERESIGVWEGLKLVTKNKPLMVFTVAAIIGAFRGVAEMNALYIGQFKYGATTEDGLKLFSMLSPIIGFAATPAMLLLPFMTRKMNNNKILIFWQILTIVPYTVLLFIGYENIPSGTAFAVVMTVVRFITNGTALGTLQPIMFSEMYDYQQYKTGRRLEGFIQTFAVSLTGLASQVAMFIPALIQKAVGFQPMNFKNGAEYLPSNIAIMDRWFTISTVMALVSSILFVIVISFYPLSKKKYNEVMIGLEKQADGELE